MPPTRSSTTSAAAGLDALLRKAHEQEVRCAPANAFTIPHYARVTGIREDVAAREVKRLAENGTFKALGTFPAVDASGRVRQISHYAVVKKGA